MQYELELIIDNATKLWLQAIMMKPYIYSEQIRAVKNLS